MNEDNNSVVFKVFRSYETKVLEVKPRKSTCRTSVQAASRPTNDRALRSLFARTWSQFFSKI